MSAVGVFTRLHKYNVNPLFGRCFSAIVEKRLWLFRLTFWGGCLDSPPFGTADFADLTD